MLMEIPRMGCQRGEAALCHISWKKSSQLSRCCIQEAAVASVTSAVAAQFTKKTRVDRLESGAASLASKMGFSESPRQVCSAMARETILARYYSSLDRSAGVGVDPDDTRDGGQNFALP